MKMSRFEKLFVNSSRHSNRVAEQAHQLVRTAAPKPRQRLLDVGCGNGAAAIGLANTLGLLVTGIDVDTEQIEAAASAGAELAGVRLLAADATRLPFADGEFDMVCSNKTIHHIREWQQALTEMTRVLKPEGHLVYSDFVAPAGHRLPTRRALNRFADQHGLQIVQRSGSLLHYTGVFRKVNTEQRISARATQSAPGQAVFAREHLTSKLESIAG
jgi:ubiquinone/menaquinone biosynthesis C-methylase UbiE